MPAAAQPPASAFSRFGADSTAVTPAAPDSTPPAPAAALTIGRLSVEGNVGTDSSRVLRTFEVGTGSRFSEDALRRGLRKLFALGLFEDVWLDRQQRGGVVDIVIHVRERARLSSIDFTGNKKRETSELQKKLFLKVGEVYSPVTVRNQVDTLLTYYRDEGYAQAGIDALADTLVAQNQVKLRFVVREGEKVKITKIVFEGAGAFPEKKLRKAMKTKTKGFFGGGDVKDENLTEDHAKLEAHYRSNGYRDARVVEHRLEPGDTPRHLTLHVKIEEGRPYRVGAVTWSGNQVIDTPALAKLWTPKVHEKYDVSKIERVQGMAYGEYAEKGYLYVNVEPRETVRDSLVDVAYLVGEGQPSNIRMVNISGNKGTREKVIRREIAIHEGDRFKRSALVRTQGDIFRLGIFEDVQVDFAPADSTDVDINLKVKEKQVGTASAGAGYTSESGLTGFLELGHNNVLGNGQSLQLHLERGGKREDYFLSFTEPWFRDTPTLLGYSVFNTVRERDVYSEKRVGGSARIGRPLPWPDYSRGSVNYRLENVTIDTLGAFSAVDSAVLRGVRIGEGTLTSSVEVDFSRNSTNNPFYPTKGTRLSLDHEFAGGPFGGGIHFHKHRIEGRAYLPSFTRAFTTMLRARVGLLGEYADQNTPAPPYERFRLGGGSTTDPLRGYDDYQVVPSKFVYDVISPVTTIVDGPNSTKDTVTTYVKNRVRYPGGRFMALYSVEQQFPIVHPLHGVIFFDAGNTWDLWKEIQPFNLKIGAGAGIRLEIPLLGNIGFDYGYGFDRDDGPRGKGHFLIGNVNF